MGIPFEIYLHFDKLNSLNAYDFYSTVQTIHFCFLLTEPTKLVENETPIETDPEKPGIANSISSCDINAEKRDESEFISSSSFPMLISGASEFNKVSLFMYNNNPSNNLSNQSKLATEPRDTFQSVASTSTSQVAKKQSLLHTNGDDHGLDKIKYSLSTDQSDDSRYHKARDGVCLVSSRLYEDGVFWIKPALDEREHKTFDQMYSDIERFVKETQYKSYNS